MYTEPRNKADLLSQVEKPVKKSRLIARSTLRINYEDGSEAIRYHDTDVVTFHPNGNVELDSGGFRTATTKNRINEHTNLNLYQEAGIWYIGMRGNTPETFYDGITFDSKGVLVGESITPDFDRIKLVKKSIKNFVNKIDRLEEIPMPSAGDCWLCMAGQTSCLKEHIKEGYLHGTLIYKALEMKGYRDPIFIMKMGIRDSIKRALRDYLKRELLPELAR